MDTLNERVKARYERVKERLRMEEEQDAHLKIWSRRINKMKSNIDKCPNEELDNLSAVGYEALGKVLMRAFNQAAHGKGNERHGNGKPFGEQPMQLISDLLGDHHGLLFQAIKKTQESTRMGSEAAARELLGAINYLAGAIVYLEAKEKKRS